MRVVWVGAVATVCLASAGCALFDQKPAVERRAKEFIAALFTSPDSAVNLVDPAVVRAKGEGLLKIQLHLVAGVLKAGGVTADEVKITDISIDKDGKSATVSVTIPNKLGGTGKTHPPQTHRFVKGEDGQWYISL